MSDLINTSKPMLPPSLARFVAATAGRNMTRPAYLAMLIGVATMILLTVNPAYEAAHFWVDAILWACLAFFTFEWLVRLRHAVLAQRGPAYMTSFRGVMDAAAVLAVPAAMLLVRNPTGISHSPEEAVSLEDAAIATRVVERAVELLA